jgi:hypothetical protein
MRRRAVVAVAALLVVAGLAASPVRAADPDFGRPTASSHFGEAVEFSQPVVLDGVPDSVEVLLEFPGALGPHVIPIAPPDRTGSVTFRHAILLAEGHLLPNTSITARWRVTTDGKTVVGPPATVLYSDSRFDWKTRQGDIVRVHWYEGSDAFGERALRIGDSAVRETASLLGVTEREPVDFFIYANQDEFYDALGPGTRENVGGQANAEIRTMFALISPGEIDDPWVEIVVPHELVHLVFDTTVDNPYHFPPRWLNEGLAVYLSEGYPVRDRLSIENAARDGTLIPLEGLTGQFPTTLERFSLAYAESVSAVDYFIRTYGRDSLIALIRSYAQGRTDDEAFEAAIDLDVAGFDKAWRTDLAAKEPTAYGPQPAPAGPVPPGWTDAEGSTAPSQPPGAPGPTSTPGNPTGEGGPGPTGIAVLLVAVAVVVGAIALLAARRRPRPQPPAA